MSLMSEHSFLHFVRVENIGPKGVLDLASVRLDLIMEPILRRDDDLLAHLKLLLFFEWIIGIFVSKHELQLLAHLVFQVLG